MTEHMTGKFGWISDLSKSDLYFEYNEWNHSYNTFVLSSGINKEDKQQIEELVMALRNEISFRLVGKFKRTNATNPFGKIK